MGKKSTVSEAAANLLQEFGKTLPWKGVLSNTYVDLMRLIDESADPNEQCIVAMLSAVPDDINLPERYWGYKVVSFLPDGSYRFNK